MKENKKICIFARCSTQKQVDRGNLSHQIEVCKNFIKSNLPQYKDKDIIIIAKAESSLKLQMEERGSIKELENLINKGIIDCVVSYELSRITRRSGEYPKIENIFIDENGRSKGIQLILLKPSPIYLLQNDGRIDLTTKFIFYFYQLISENEILLKKERNKRFWEETRKQNKYIGGKILFGYDKDNERNFIPHKTNKKVVQDIFNLYINHSVKKVKYFDTLENKQDFDFVDNPNHKYIVKDIDIDIVAKTKKQIGKSYLTNIVTNPIKDIIKFIKKNYNISLKEHNIYKILRNDSYIGATQNTTSVNNLENYSYPPIIDKEVFDIVQKILAVRFSEPKKNTKKEKLLKNIIVCDCGNVYTSTQDKYKCLNCKSYITNTKLDSIVFNKITKYAKLYNQTIKQIEEETRKKENLNLAIDIQNLQNDILFLEQQHKEEQEGLNKIIKNKLSLLSLIKNEKEKAIKKAYNENLKGIDIQIDTINRKIEDISKEIKTNKDKIKAIQKTQATFKTNTPKNIQEKIKQMFEEKNNLLNLDYNSKVHFAQTLIQSIKIENNYKFEYQGKKYNTLYCQLYFNVDKYKDKNKRKKEEFFIVKNAGGNNQYKVFSFNKGIPSLDLFIPHIDFAVSSEQTEQEYNNKKTKTIQEVQDFIKERRKTSKEKLKELRANKKGS